MSVTIAALSLPVPPTEIRDKSVTKVSAFTAPKGTLGQKYLATGKHLGMRLFEKESVGEKASTVRDYGNSISDWSF